MSVAGKAQVQPGEAAGLIAGFAHLELLNVGLVRVYVGGDRSTTAAAGNNPGRVLRPGDPALVDDSGGPSYLVTDFDVGLVAFYGW